MKFIGHWYYLILVLLVLILLTPSPVFAQLQVGPLKAPEDPSSANWDSFFQTNHTANTLENAASCFGAGFPFGGRGCDVTVLAPDGSWKNKLAFNGEGGGALGAATGLMANMTKTAPASGVHYVAEIFTNDLHIIPPAYAQVSGSGAAVISPVQSLWTVTRNIAYAGFMIIFVVVGFMIMFRRRINPQTVVSVQTALPGLVIGLILVTFSFFIAGLIIDAGFLLTQIIGILVIGQIGTAGTNPGAVGAVNDLINKQNVISMFTNFVFSGNLLSSSANIGADIAGYIYQSGTNRVILGVLGVLAACLNPLTLTAIGVPGAGVAVAAACVSLGAAGGGAGAGVIISGLVYLVLLFGLLQAMFRLLFGLIGAYVTIVLNTIFGPFFILGSSIPGQGGLLSYWWRSLAANVLIFPAVFGLFLIIAAILGFAEPWYLNGNKVGQFSQTLPLFGGSPVGFVQVILAYGMLLVSPAIPDVVRDLFRAQTNQRIGRVQEQGIRGGTGAATAGVGLLRAGWTVLRPPRP